MFLQEPYLPFSPFIKERFIWADFSIPQLQGAMLLHAMHHK